MLDRDIKFEATKTICSESSTTVWESIRECWIDVYLGPPELIVYDSGRNFIEKEFNSKAEVLDIRTMEIPIEAL